jgi:hypothetical protein
VLAFCGTVAAPLAITAPQAAQAAVVSNKIRDRLAPYGQWRQSARFGEVWVPNVAAGWRPFTIGHWVWTDEGWYWQSDEPFGWVVYHYGRWVLDDKLGWVWFPGNEWAPAWVVWRESNDDIGWAPAPPPELDVAVSDSWWSFVPVAAIGSGTILGAVLPVDQNVTIVRNTTIINENVVINRSPHRGTARIGNSVVPINAGPSLSRLPAKVAKEVKAARVVPPRKGAITTAHLDASKGAAVKRMTARIAKAKQPAAPGNGAQPPSVSNVQNRPNAAASASVAAAPATKPVKPTRTAGTKRQPNAAVATAKRVPNARIAKVPRRKPPVVAAPRRPLASQHAVLLQPRRNAPPKRAPGMVVANPAIRPAARPRPSEARAVVQRPLARPHPTGPANAPARRSPAGCDPRTCKGRA